MANIAIIDTGYPNTSKTGNIAGTLVNSGSALNLKTADIKITRGGGTDTNPSPNSFSDVVMSRASSQNQKVVITGIIDMTSDGAALARQIDQLCTTSSVKLLYYTGTDTSDRHYYNAAVVFGNANSADGHTDSGNELAASTPHLHCQFQDAGFTFDAKTNKMRFQLQGWVTA